MKRRQFITLLGGAAASWPLAARAQQPALPVIGFLNTRGPAEDAHLVVAFRQGLTETGYIEGSNVKIEYRWAEGHSDRLPGLAADLVRRQVSVIAANSQATVAAKGATSTIPIVFITGADPVQVGFVTSLRRPGGNLTGVASLDTELGRKRLQMLHELLPNARTIAALVNPTFPGSDVQTADLQAAASAPLIYLRVVGSQNGSIDCDPNQPNLRAEIGSGCAPLYKLNPGSSCPSYTDLWGTPQPWDCVKTQTGGATGQVKQGMLDRIGNSCAAAPITWPYDPTKPDPRVIPLIVTPFGTFTGSGNDIVPVVGS